MEAVIDNTPKVAQIQTGFAKRNALEERIEKEEKELEALQKANVQQPDDEDAEEPTSAEEKTFKKRYGDLRRHSQKQQADLQKQIDD